MSIKGKIMAELEKRPRRINELKAKLGNDKKVARAMEELVKRNKVTNKNGVYAVAGAAVQDAQECVLVKLGATFGFAKPTGEGNDVFIPGRLLQGAMPGDTVLVAVTDTPRVQGSTEGAVVSITKENNEFVGTVVRNNGRLCLMPDACPQTLLQIKKSADGGAKEGEKAAVVILERGDSHEDHRVGVSLRFGAAEEARHCAKSILYSHNIIKQFPAKVKAEAKQFENITLNENEITKRTDMRDAPIFTIDGADTKDIDDAVCVEKTDDGYVLGVHIADVSYYVRSGSELNKEAFTRGTSVYYADNVIPMLPRQLSNGICSLNPGEDRFAFSCIMVLDKNAEVKKFAFSKTIIRSRVKGVYSELNAILGGSADAQLQEKYAEVAPQIPLLHEVYTKLDKLRSARGCMEIESGEAKLIINEDGRCVDVVKRTRGESEKIIEECMLLANACAAKYAAQKHLPFVYRTHQAPDEEKIEDLRRVLKAAGVDCKFEKAVPTTQELAELLRKTKGTPLETFVHTSVLRSMAKAKYEPDPKGHFGLALADYAHFTSPIRRYPDLAIHRILSDSLAGVSEEDLVQKYTVFATEASVQSSTREVAAMQAERDAEDCYKAEYMAQFIGQSFTGVISGVTNFGVYVQLPNTVEGLLRAEKLSAHALTLTDMCLHDALSGKSWRLGDEIKVTLEDTNVPLGHIDFALA